MTSRRVDGLDAYARRIGFGRPQTPDLATLRAMHRAHLEAVPFENSSVLFGEPVVIDQVAFVRKLGVDGRGGFCYELNWAFGALLEDLGYDVAYLEGRVYADERLDGSRFEHLALRVTLDEPWLVDVGFGHFFSEPLRLVPGLVQEDPMGEFRLVPAAGGTDVEWRHRTGKWVAHYRFDPQPRDLAEFAPTCADLQASAASPFVGGWVCSRIQGSGGVTLFGRHLVDTTAGERVDRELDDDATVEILDSRFGIAARRVGGSWRPAAS